MSIEHLFPDSAGCSRPSRATAWPAGTEPALDEVLADPLVHLVMQRDGVSLATLRQIVADAQAGLVRETCPCRAA